MTKISFQAHFVVEASPTVEFEVPPELADMIRRDIEWRGADYHSVLELVRKYSEDCANVSYKVSDELIEQCNTNFKPDWQVDTLYSPNVTFSED